jgi:DNA polymerase delta subunit 1
LVAARKLAKRQLASCKPEEETKKKVLNGRQLALKLSANSVYGFTGALNGPLPCLEVARAVTSYGRQMIHATKCLVESHFVKTKGYACDAKVLYGDTDSVMVRFGSDDLSMEEAMKLSKEAAEVCSAAFPDPVHLEFEKVYRPFLLMAKKRYSGLAWTNPNGSPSIETKGLETVRRDWSDLVRQGLEQTLQILLQPDNSDGKDKAVAYVKSLVEELRQNTMDLRSLVISKSLSREEYATQTPHSALADKLRKRDPVNAPRVGERVSYLVLAGAAKSKVYERVEDPLYALEHDFPVDAEYYLENQLKQPLIRVFELVCGSAEKAEQALFTTAAGQKVTTVAPTMGGMGKFMKAKPKCVSCNKASAKSDTAPFCAECEAKGDQHILQVKQVCISKAQALRTELADLRSYCDKWCDVPVGPFAELALDKAGLGEVAADREVCQNANCQVIFRRVRAAKVFKTASNALDRLSIKNY